MTIRENGKVARELSKGHAEPGRRAGEGQGTPGLRAEHRSPPRGQSPGKQQRGGTFPAVAEASEGGPHAACDVAGVQTDRSPRRTRSLPLTMRESGPPDCTRGLAADHMGRGAA